MDVSNLPVKIASFTLVGIGVVLLALSIYLGPTFNLALPLVFLVLGGGFFILVFSLRQKLAWSSFLYIPATLLTAFGIVFLLNVLTRDWNSWAYSWLFLVAAVGVGMLLTNHEHEWSPAFEPIGWSLTLGGITLFAIFGAIAGGMVIQLMAPILLVAAGLALRYLHVAVLVTSSKSEPPAQAQSRGTAIPGTGGLVEPLSSRELDVLRLIDAGLSNQQIADKLSVAPSTVKTHINNIYGKLGVQTRVQAVTKARELSLLDA
ncbi:MAG TPA: response regulator transcription factor [Longilinea sp.]|nr:response regulator transcription factor [Longilinea sp.]